MPSINKLLDKINQASSAVKSVKGIKSKIESIGYKGGVNTEELDKLQQQAEESRKALEDRRSSLQSQLNSSAKAGKKAKRNPDRGTIDLQYPLNGGDIDNFLVFNTRKRKPREEGSNLLSDRKFAIALPLPADAFSQNTEVSYEVTEIGSLARSIDAKIQGGEEAGGVIDEVMNAAKGYVENALGSMGGGVGNLRAGRAVNPMEEQTLKGITFRDHSFAWDLYPRNLDEAKQIHMMINLFRLAMLPDTFASKDNDESNATENFFNYPNVFDVEIEGPVKTTMERFLPMVCKSMSVTPYENPDYMIGSSDDLFFSGKVSLSLEFSEIKILSQEVYYDRVAAEAFASSQGSISGDASGSPSIFDESTQGGGG